MNGLPDLLKRLEVLKTQHEPWKDNDDDGFLSAVGALPGETALDALRRQARQDWSDSLNEVRFSCVSDQIA